MVANATLESISGDLSEDRALCTVTYRWSLMADPTFKYAWTTTVDMSDIPEDYLALFEASMPTADEIEFA